MIHTFSRAMLEPREKIVKYIPINLIECIDTVE